MNKQLQFNLDDLDFSQPLIMIETMTYFEAYRHVLQALQLIDINESFPLAPFILKLDHEVTPPDYVKPTTTYDFTPLLVNHSSNVKTTIINPGSLLREHRARLPNLPMIGKELRITYEQSNRIENKHRSVLLLDKTQWPTSDELHLNPKQREALILALTNKVALIQGRK